MCFSVLMSIYKNEKKEFLERCFESIKEQSLFPDEIVLVIDGPISKDLMKCITEWCDILPLQLVKIDENIGLGKALNIGLEHCKYNIIMRMDTDDICANNRFEMQYNYLKCNNNIVVLGGAIQEFGTDLSDLKGVRMMPSSLSEIRKLSKYRNPINHMTVAFRKNIVLSVGGYEHHLYMEDYNLWLRLLSVGYDIANLNQIMVYARVGNDFENRRRGIKYIKSEWKLFILKKNLNILSFATGLFIFFMRSLPRILPVYLLKKTYGLLRK